MTEIKCRSWNMEKATWDYFQVKVGTPLTISEAHDQELYLCVGLKDIKGKDIYEGDLCTQEVDGQEYQGEVSIEITRGVMVGFHPISIRTVKVIGDATSTPELIK